MAHCSGCGLKVRFWPVDGAKVTCVNCGLNHEVECDEALDLSTGEKTKLVMLVVAVGQPKDESKVDASEN